MNSKRLLVVVALAIGAALLQWLTPRGTEPELTSPSTESVAIPSVAPAPVSGAIEAAFAARASNRQVEGHGVVSKVLKDDNKGSRHQRFILTLQSGHTILIAHNIDLASRIDPLREGDAIRFFGEYEWNPQGGVVHWTHHDPAGRHANGWLEHQGRRYE